MGKSIRNSDPQTVSNKEDVLSLLAGGQSDPIAGPGKQPPAKPVAQPASTKTTNSKEEVMDLLGGTVKKKDGDGGSGSTTSQSTSISPVQAVSAYQNKTLTPQAVDVLANTDEGKKMGLNLLSPEAKEVFATAHNGQKRSDLVGAVSKIIDASYPESKDFNQNKARFQIQQSVLHGDQSAILNLKKGVIDGLQQKINQRQEELLGGVAGKAAWMTKEVITNSDPAIQQLRAQQQQAAQTIDDYGKMALVSSKDMEPWLKLDSEHPNILTSVAADKLGKMVEEKYGITSTSKNKEYDRMRTGFDLITRTLQMDINEALAAGIPSKDPTLLKRAQDKLSTLARYRDMYDKLDTEQFPDVGLDKTARYLGDIIAEKHPNKLIRTKEDVRDAATVANERNPGFIDKYGKFVDVAAEKQGEGTFIPRGGGRLNEFIGGLTTSSAKAAVDLLTWRANVFGYDQDKEELAAKEASPGMRGTTQSKTEPTKIVFDTEGKAYREMPNENYGTLPWNNFFRFAGESIPSLLEFIGAEGATTAVAEITTGAKMTKSASQLTGLIGATYITSYNSNREFADANIDDKSSRGEARKIVAANLMTLANAGVFHILNASPSKMVEAAISKSVMPEVVALMEKNNWEKLSEKTLEGFMKEEVLPRAKAVVSKFAESAGSGIKMGSAAVVDKQIKDLVGTIANPKYTPSTIEDNARAFVSQALLMTGIGLPGMIRTGIMPHSTKEALHQVGLYGPQYIDMINDRVQSGEMDMHQGAGIISMIKTMGEELSKASQQTNDDGTPLTTRQQRDIALTGFRARGAAAMEENSQEVKQGAASAAEKESKEIRKENNWQAIEETPVFKSITNYDGGEKVKSMDEIDPEKGYSWVDADGKKVDADGATLLHYLETGDIYEKEQVQEPGPASSDTEKVENAEGKGQKSTPAEEKEVVKRPGKEDENVPRGNISPEDNIPVHELVGKPVLYKGQKGTLQQDGQALVFKVEGKNREYEIGNVDEIKDQSAKGLGIEQENSVVSANDAGNITVRGKEYVNKYSDPLAAINYDKEGNVVSVNLETPEGQKRTFRGPVAEDVAYQIHLKEITDANEQPALEEFINSDEPTRKEIDDARLTADAEDQTTGNPEKIPGTEAQTPEIAPEQQATDLQGSYDRLIASGSDPNEPEMKALKERIDNLLSPKTENNGNDVQKTEIPASQEGGSQEGGEENAEKGKEGNVLKEGDGATPPAEGSAASTSGRNPGGITHEENEKRRLEESMKSYVKNAQTFEEWDRAADDLLSKGYNVDDLISEIEKTGRATNEVENAILKKYIATIDKTIETNPTPELVGRRRRFVLMKDLSNSAAGRALVSLKGSGSPGDTLADFIQAKMEVAGMEEMSDAQIKDQQAKYEELKKANDQYKAEIERLKKTQTAPRAEKALKKVKDTATAPRRSKGTKTKEDLAKERKDILKKMREDLLKTAKGGQGLTASIPGVAQLVAIAPHVGKLVKNLVEDGILSLDQVIDRVHDEIKDFIPGISKGDVRDIIAGEYASQKVTRNALSEQLRNLKRESQLLNELDKVRKGEDGKTDEQKLSKTRRIAELEAKVKEARRANKQKLADEQPVEEKGGKKEKDYHEQLADRQNRLKKDIADVETKLAKKIYEDEPDKATPLKLDKKTQELQDRLIELRRKRANELARVQYQNLSPLAKGMDKFWQVLGLKRLIQTAVDFSMPLRQAVITSMNPLKLKTTGQAFRNMFLHTFQPKEFKRFMFRLEESGLRAEMERDGITLSEPDELVMDKREEEFRSSMLDRIRQSSSPWATPVKWLMEPVFASERAAASYMNTVRINEYVKKTDVLKRAGVTPENSPEIYQSASKWIMNSTGRGNMLKFIEDSRAGREIAGNTFYGARLMASRFNMLNPTYYYKMPKEVRVQAMKDMAGFTSGLLLSGLALSAAGGQISLNPDDSDFMQVRFGDKVYDLTGGMVQYVRTFLRLTELSKKQVFDKSNPYDEADTKKYTGFAERSSTKFFTNKLAPNTAYAYHFLTGKGGDGQDFRPNEILEYYPMYVDDMKKGWAEDGPTSFLTILMPNIFGMGVQQYDKK